MNLDKNQNFPNQELTGQISECTALSATDICGNILKMLFDPDFTYASTFYTANTPPSTAGADPRAAMYSVPLCGLLPISKETFTSKVMGELYAANLQNYNQQQKNIAMLYRMCAKPVPLDYQDVIKVLQSGYAVSLAMKWYWGPTPPVVLTVPQPGDQYSDHNVAIYDWQDPRGLTIKPWLGASAGEGGYCFLPKEVFDESAVFTMQFDSHANVALQAISLKIVYYPAFNALFA